MSLERRAPQKTIPDDGRKTRISGNGNGHDSHLKNTQPLYELSTRLSGQKPPANSNGNSEILEIYKNGSETRIFASLPLVDKPLTPATKVKRGGTIGAGTSKKSLNTQKRNQRNRS